MHNILGTNKQNKPIGRGKPMAELFETNNAILVPASSSRWSGGVKNSTNCDPPNVEKKFTLPGMPKSMIDENLCFNSDGSLTPYYHERYSFPIHLVDDIFGNNSRLQKNFSELKERAVKSLLQSRKISQNLKEVNKKLRSDMKPGADINAIVGKTQLHGVSPDLENSSSEEELKAKSWWKRLSSRDLSLKSKNCRDLSSFGSSSQQPTGSPKKNYGPSNTIFKILEDHLGRKSSMKSEIKPSYDFLKFNLNTPAPSVNASRFNYEKISNNNYSSELISSLEKTRKKTASSRVILTREKYYCIPDSKCLHMFENSQGLVILDYFEVGHVKYGKIVFSSKIDVTGLNLDEIIHFSHNKIVMYPDKKSIPPQGEGLNQKSTITLYQVWPKNDSQVFIKHPDFLNKINFEEYLASKCALYGAKHLAYYPKKGFWIFEISEVNSIPSLNN